MDFISPKAPETHDYLAEMFVAGKLADAGWNVYFPRRDKGFDFIITKSIGGQFIMRPVQVKGKYPEPNTTERELHGYIGHLTELHDEMVLAVAFFDTATPGEDAHPSHVAYLPRTYLKPSPRGFRTQPAKLTKGRVQPRPAYAWTFDRKGILAMEAAGWSHERPPSDPNADKTE